MTEEEDRRTLLACAESSERGEEQNMRHDIHPSLELGRVESQRQTIPVQCPRLRRFPLHTYGSLPSHDTHHTYVLHMPSPNEQMSTDRCLCASAQ